LRRQGWVVEVVYAPATRRSITGQVRVLLEAFWFALSLGLLMVWPAHDLRVSRRFALVVVVATRCSIASCAHAARQSVVDNV
jgi:hypothetical protein